MERKLCVASEFKASDGDTPEFKGYGAVFGNIDLGGDIIEPGAFTESLKRMAEDGETIPMYSNHNWHDLPVGAWIDIAEDSKGLPVHGALADTTMGRDINKLMRMRPKPAIKGLSIGYKTRQARPDTVNGKSVRRLIKLDLVEVSIVTTPMNRSATISLVKSIQQLPSLRDVESYLIFEQNFSEREAKTLIARIKALESEPDVSAELREVAEALRRRGEALA